MPELHLGTLPGGGRAVLDLEDPRYVREGARIGTFAGSGAGKGYLVGVLLEELIAAGRPVVMVDPEGELHTFREAGAFVVGGRHGHVALPQVAGGVVYQDGLARLAQAAIDTALHGGPPLVFDLDGLGGSEITGAFEVIAGAYWSLVNADRVPSVFAITEAHLVAPQVVPRGATPGVVLPRLLSGGRKRGVITVLETQRTQEIAKSVIRHCNVRFIGRFDDVEDYRQVSAGMPRGVTFEEVSNLESGTFYAPRLFGDALLRVRERKVTHGGATPGGGGEVLVRPAAAAQERAIARLAEQLQQLSPPPVPAGEPEEAPVPPGAQRGRRREATLEQPNDAAARDLATVQRELNEIRALSVERLAALQTAERELETARDTIEHLRHENDEAYAHIAGLERALGQWDAVALALTAALAGKGTLGADGAGAAAGAAARPATVGSTSGPELDESRVVELIRRHAPAASAPALVPVEALRARYLEAAAQRLVAVMRDLDPDQREALLFLLTRDAFVSINAVAVGISGSDSGSVRERWSKALQGLVGRDLAVVGGSGRSGRRASVDAWVRSALSPHNPSDAEVAQVRDRALSVLMTEGGAP